MSFKLPDLGADFSMLGHWWLPSRPSNEVAGILSCKNGRMSLRLFGQLPGIDLNAIDLRVPVIYGVAEAKAITLENCFQTHSGFKIPGTVEQGFIVSLAFLGPHIENPSTALFRDGSVALTHLGPWFGEEPAKLSFQTSAEGKVGYVSHSYEPLKSQKIEISGCGFSIQVHYVLSTGGENYRSKEFTYSAVLAIYPDQPSSIEWILQQHARMHELMELLIGSETIPRRMHCTDGGAEHFEVRFGAAASAQTKEIPAWEVLVPFAAVQDRLAGIVQRFWADYDKVHEPLSLLRSALHDEQIGQHVRLLLLCQAVECFHRNVFGGQYLSEDDYAPTKKTLIDAIPKGLEQSLKESLKSRISFGYQYSLRKRLEKTFDWIGAGVTASLGVQDQKAFAKDVKEARNFYTHWDPSNSHGIPKGAALSNIVVKLGAIAQLALLKHLGVEPTYVVSRMRHLNNHLRYLPEYRALE